MPLDYSGHMLLYYVSVVEDLLEMVPAVCWYGVLTDIEITQHVVILLQDVDIIQYVSYLTRVAWRCFSYAQFLTRITLIPRICLCGLDWH